MSDEEVSFTVRSSGICPLDGYPLIEFEPDLPNSEGGWEHVIPNEELRKGPAAAVEAQRRIAEAHGFETVAAAEQITKEARS